MLLLQHGAAGTPYNVGSDEPVSIARLAECVRDRLSPGREIVFGSAPANAGRSRYVPDVERIRALGATMRSSLDAVIDEAADSISLTSAPVRVDV
ncbi:hypothetical protein AB2M62_16945 [Sphingomonas sp. MMS12-HWE2-04]|uniref:hypothetical protein n=1 Tax=Sphingomonas sp. MMS12-HWE2-04 TaxID=3234199 RepID=UPI00384D5622